MGHFKSLISNFPPDLPIDYNFVFSSLWKNIKFEIRGSKWPIWPILAHRYFTPEITFFCIRKYILQYKYANILITIFISSISISIRYSLLNSEKTHFISIHSIPTLIFLCKHIHTS